MWDLCSSSLNWTQSSGMSLFALMSNCYHKTCSQIMGNVYDSNCWPAFAPLRLIGGRKDDVSATDGSGEETSLPFPYPTVMLSCPFLELFITNGQSDWVRRHCSMALSQISTQDKQMRKISKNVSANLDVQFYKSDTNTHSWLLWTYDNLNLWMVADCGRHQDAPFRFLQERTRCSFAKALISI